VRRLAPCLAILSALLASPATGQDVVRPPAQAPAETEAPAPEGDTTIVVTGKSEEGARREAYEQTRDVSRVGRYQLYDETLPRFEAPLCPSVLGINREQAGEIADRIRDNASRLMVRVGGQRCEPNLFVAFAEDGQELVSRLASTHRSSFCIVEESEQEEILRDGEPVRVWNFIRIIDIRNGGGPTRIFHCREDVPSQGSKVGMFLPERRDIVTSLVVFDREQVVGMTTVQLADYATMRGLSHTRPADGTEPMETILALFAGDRASPLELTRFDVSYLEDLYSGRPDLRAQSRFLGIGERAEEAHENARER
jgi:hypothetical protein